MVRKELISRISAVLRENNIRKPVSFPKHVFHISDDEGNQKDFVAKKTDKMVLYTTDDVAAILDACQYVIQETLKQGEEISIHGFGRLGLKYQKEKTVHNIRDSQLVTIDGHYSPRFLCGNDLKRCAQIYEQSLKDLEINKPLPVFSEEEDE